MARTNDPDAESPLTIVPNVICAVSTGSESPYIFDVASVVIVKGALSTLMLTVFVTVLKFASSVGMKFTESIWLSPAFNRVVAVGV
ncbi:hypothetical protein D3C72_1243370 [compost metagenome]